jgi:hypothetical protein
MRTPVRIIGYGAAAVLLGLSAGARAADTAKPWDTAKPADTAKSVKPAAAVPDRAGKPGVTAKPGAAAEKPAAGTAEAGKPEAAKAQAAAPAKVSPEIQAILGTGDGKSPATAYAVTSTGQEAQVLSASGLHYVSQAPVTSGEHHYDMLLAAQADGTVVGRVYFNIDAVSHAAERNPAAEAKPAGTVPAARPATEAAQPPAGGKAAPDAKKQGWFGGWFD